MKRSTLLILSTDPVASALLGMLAESAGYTPVFPDDGEQPEEALSRVRPVFVVLLDAALAAARSDIFFARAARRRVGLAIIRRVGDDNLVATWASERDVPCFDVPTEAEHLLNVVEAASVSEWWRSGADRRRTPRSEYSPDGTLVYVDRVGRRWSVYDRRRAERRRDASAMSAYDGAERVFVDDAGGAWRCALREIDECELLPAALERQLARASRVEPGDPLRSE